MDPLTIKLQRLGLAEYRPVLLENGFDAWEVILDIKEDDLQQLGFKRGHRRILQKEIEKYRQDHSDRASPPQGSGSSTAQSGDNTTPPDDYSSSPPPVKAKRRYRWHPRPDANAPKRPKTAYVRFSDQLRQDPNIASMSFVDIAKEVGWRWQQMEPNMKQKYELEAARDIQEYEDRMREYKQTSSYQEYQDYLLTFRKDPVKPSRPKLRNQPPYEASLSSSALSLTSQASRHTSKTASPEARGSPQHDQNPQSDYHKARVSNIHSLLG